MSMADDNTLRSYRSNDPYRRSADRRRRTTAACRQRSAGRTCAPDRPDRSIRRHRAPRSAPSGEPRDRAPAATARATGAGTSSARTTSDAGRAAVRRRPRYAGRCRAMPRPITLGTPTHRAGSHRRSGRSDADRIAPDRTPSIAAVTDADHACGPCRDPSIRPRPTSRPTSRARIHAAARRLRRQPAPHGEDDYDDPPRRKRGNGLVTAVHPDRLRHARHRRRLRLSHLRHVRPARSRRRSSSPTARRARSFPRPSRSPRARRIASRGQGSDERLVSREEQPVALADAGAVGGLRASVFPAPVPAGAGRRAGATPAARRRRRRRHRQRSAPIEPKRVRTVTIRPRRRRHQRPAGRRNRTPARAAPRRAHGTATTAAARPRRRRARARPAVARSDRRPRRRPRAARRRSSGALTPPAPRETAATGARAAPGSASAPSTGGSGGYLVQVSSQRSEADAQASYRALQAKYPQLKSRQPIIRRADLGAKGTLLPRHGRAVRLGRAKPTSSAPASSPPAGSALSSGTDAVVDRARLDPRGSGGLIGVDDGARFHHRRFRPRR